MQRVVKQCKRSYYSNKVEALKESNVARWWREIKGLAGGKQNDEWFHQMLDENIPTVDALAERFNTFLYDLTSHFVPLRTLVDTAVEVPGEFLVDSRTAFKALREIKTRKSSGPDCIPSKVLKLFAFELEPVITDLYNTSLVQGVVPSQFKSSLVVPIPTTTPPKTVEEDLQPITLTSQLAKIMEGFTLNLLYKQVVDQLDNKQFAVCGKSTTHALVYLVHCILEYLDKGACYVRLFLADFSKGFDLVDHTVLTRLLPKKILKGPSELNAEKLGAQHTVHV